MPQPLLSTAWCWCFCAEFCASKCMSVFVCTSIFVCQGSALMCISTVLVPLGSRCCLRVCNCKFFLFPFLFFFFWWSAVWFVSECLSSWSWEFAAESQHSISLPSLATLASLSSHYCFPPVGCTVAEGSKRGFYPSWAASHKLQLLLPWLLLFLQWNTVVSKWYKYDLAY